MTDLYLIRHAQCEINCRPEYIWGRTNESPLTERGEREAAALGTRLNREQIIFHQIYSSPAIRPWMTITRAAPYFPRDKIIVAPELQELDQGTWTGRLRAEIYTPEQKTIIDKDNWNFAAPGGESQAHVGARMYSLVEEAVMKSPYASSLVAFSTHGIAIKCLLSILLDADRAMTWRWQIDNTSITQLRYEQERWWPIRINDAAHLCGIA